MRGPTIDNNLGDSKEEFMEADLAKTPLYAWHAEHGGRLVDFAGWAMPVQYVSISSEHQATRTAASLFDVSHMGRFRIQGPDACQWLDHLLTRTVTDLSPGRIRYSLVTADDGGILDDVLVYCMPAPAAPEGRVYWMVVNASNRTKIWSWLQEHSGAGGAEAYEIQDLTLETAMIAVQGPLAVGLVAQVLALPHVTNLRNYAGAYQPVEGTNWLYSRTGYTGEDGIELIVPAEAAEPVWQRLWEAGMDSGLVAAGLGARDTLRLEAAMPLYGHELDESITPWQAGLDFAVNLAERDFPGHAALSTQKRDSLPRRVGLQLDGKRVARQHAAVVGSDGANAGEVTSGTFSPTLERAIAMAYVAPPWAVAGTAVSVDIRGRLESATVVPLPFYRRK